MDCRFSNLYSAAQHGGWERMAARVSQPKRGRSAAAETLRFI
jgi:hypothetical protein